MISVIVIIGSQTSKKVVELLCGDVVCCAAPVPHLYTHLFLSSSRQILPRDQIILHAHKRDRGKKEVERGDEKRRGGLELMM